MPWQYAGYGCVILVCTVISLTPASQPAQPAAVAAVPVSFAEVQNVIAQRCVLCHGPAMQSKNVRLDSAEEVKKHAQAIYQQAVVLKAMPMNNATQITEAERALIGRWFTAGAATQ